MGLDQYAFRIKHQFGASVDFSPKDIPEGADLTKIAQWRKHPDLQRWMEALYREKGGKHEFNIVPVALTSEDIDKLETAVNGDQLPNNAGTGFFFGQSGPEDKEDDLAFIAEARKALADGDTVFYSSWW